MLRLPAFAASVALLGAFAALVSACGGGDSGARRVIQITQNDDACAPLSIDVKGGEKVRFEIKNEGKKDHEVEGIEGTKLEELLVPAGRTRNLDYTAPKQESMQKIKCYIPGGSATIIEVKVSGAIGSVGAGSTGAATGGTRVTAAPARDTVKVQLSSFVVLPEKPSAAAGPVKFVAENTSPTDVHELAVLRVLPDDNYENAGEIEDLQPRHSGEVTLDLPAGEYLLACLIAPGEYGSKVGHFPAGMKVAFQVR